MKSQRVRRTLVFAAAIAVAFVGVAPVSVAQPAESDALTQFRALNAQAAQLNDDFLKANEDKAARQADIDKANADLAAANKAKADAQTTEDQFRDQVDRLSQAAFHGARFDKLSALLTGTSAEDFLARSTALDVLSTDNNKALKEMAGAVDTAVKAERDATDAGRRATEARDAAQQLAQDIAAKRKDLDAQIQQLKSQLGKLSPADLALLKGTEDTTIYMPGSGAAGKAVTMALGRRGDTYSLGGSRPPVFDCSGLTMWAYAQAGVKIPRTSREQFTIGKPVSKADLQPGDLLFYGRSASSIHHVAMYIGNNMIVHASDYGIPVLSAPIEKGGKDFFGAKRIVG
ncbi:NlpC/P60 family protein [Actinocrispum wychmicini]|uniref:NlpC/P60 family protein n=1 Tax=Actinocrispum wychmicini TaxID=1213861 RepID=UPI001404DDA9|nr:NlpC/P60 family protein [Actinocrispum wychmicini]